MSRRYQQLSELLEKRIRSKPNYYISQRGHWLSKRSLKNQKLFAYWLQNWKGSISAEPQASFETQKKLGFPLYFSNEPKIGSLNSNKNN